MVTLRGFLIIQPNDFVMKSFLLLFLGLWAGVMVQARNHSIAPVFPKTPEGVVSLRPSFPAVWSGAMPLRQRAVHNRSALAQSKAAMKTAAEQWLLVGERSDLYDMPTTTWMGNDSGAYTYTPSGAELTETYANYSASAWHSTYRYIYTLNSSEWVTEELGQTWNMVSSAWENDYHALSTYDGSGNETENIYQEWTGTAWQNVSKSMSTYNGSGWLTEDVVQDWDLGSSAWVNNVKYMYSYNGAGSTIMLQVQSWDDIGSAWVNASETMITYNGDNKPVEYVFQNWDNVSSAWINSYRYLITYTPDGLYNIETYTYQNWDLPTSVWLNTGRYGYAYDGAGNQTQSIFEVWDAVGVLWQNYQRVSTSYSGANKPELTIQENWNTGSGLWEYDFKTEYAYDINDLLTQIDYYTWATLAWEPVSRNSGYTYDPASNLTFMMAETYNTSTAVFDPDTRNYYYYALFSPVGLATTRNDFGVRVFPNPVTDQISIDGTFMTDGMLQLQLLDMNGALRMAVTQPVRTGKGHISVPVGSLSAGSYVLSITDQYGHSSQVKLVK